MGLRGVLSGALALVLLQVLVTSGGGRVAGLFRVPAQIAERFLNPSLPAIPERRAEAQRGGDDRYPDPFTPRPSRPPIEPGGD